MADADWIEAIETDLLSGVRLARLIGPAMLARGWGRMVFMTSEKAAQPYPDETVYNVAEVGLASFAKSVSMAHAAEGLLANCACPAFVETPMTDGMMDGLATGEGVSGTTRWRTSLRATGRISRSDDAAAPRKSRPSSRCCGLSSRPTSSARTGASTAAPWRRSISERPPARLTGAGRRTAAPADQAAEADASRSGLRR